MFIEKIKENKATHIKLYPCHSNRASDIGHECLRYLVFSRTKWEEKNLHPVDLQFIFEEGNLHEKDVIKTLMDAGFAVIEQQRSFYIKQYNVSGHIDAKIIIDGKAIPIEIKSASPHMFERFNCVDDIVNCKYHYARKYYSQFQIYLTMCDAEYGYFIFKNKVNGQLKEIKVYRDDEMIKMLVNKAAEVNKHIENNTIPEPVSDTTICESCPFQHICGIKISEAIEIIEDDDLVDKIKERASLKENMNKYLLLDKMIKASLKGIDRKIIGDYLITGKEIIRKGFTVKEGSFWKSTIKNLLED